MRMTPEDYEALMKKRKGYPPGRLIVRPPWDALPATADPPAKAPKATRGVDRAPSEIEEMLAAQILEAKLPAPAREYPFLRGSRHRLDFAWPEHRINGMQFGCEVQGMPHRIKARFSADLEKRAAGILQGWLVLEVGGEQIRNGKALDWLKQIFARHTDQELRSLGVRL